MENVQQQKITELSAQVRALYSDGELFTYLDREGAAYTMTFDDALSFCAPYIAAEQSAIVFEMLAEMHKVATMLKESPERFEKSQSRGAELLAKRALSENE